MNKHELPAVTDGMEEHLRNGVVLAKLAKFMVPNVKFRIFDEDLAYFAEHGLNFRHTDNINAFLRSLEKIKLPAIFYPETTDVYDMKNMPKLCYCIHALSLHMFKMGLAPQIHDLEGLLKFTDEEISAMEEALTKYNIQLPVFSKIGGLLASEISIDEAALHAAILAINKAIENSDLIDLEAKMTNADAHLNDIVSSRMQQYHEQLSEERERKIMAGLSKLATQEEDASGETSADISFKVVEDTGDVYAANLTHVEIQGHVKRINREIVLDQFFQALKANNVKQLTESARELHLRSYQEANADVYCSLAVELEQVELSQLELLIEKANKINDAKNTKEQIYAEIRKAVANQDGDALVDKLALPGSGLPRIAKTRSDIYLAEIQSFDEITEEKLSEHLASISSVACLNNQLDHNEVGDFFATLHELNLDSIDDANKVLYYEALKKHNTQQDYIDLHVVQEVVLEVNKKQEFYQQQLLAVQRVNEAVTDCNEETLWSTLSDPILKLSGLNEHHLPRYMALLQRHLEQNEELWLQAIQVSVEGCHQQFEVMKKKCSAVMAINLLLIDDEIDHAQLLEMLKTDVLEYDIIDECLPAYISALIEAVQQKESDENEDTGWITEIIADNTVFFFDTNEFTGHWQPPLDRSDIVYGSQAFLSSKEIGDNLNKCTQAYNKVEEWKANGKFLIQLQSIVRMFIQKRRYQRRLQFLNSQEHAAVILQAACRGWQVRKQLQQRRQLWAQSTREIIKIQSWMRMLKARLNFLRQVEYYRKNEEYVVRIQAWWRGCFVRNDYQGLTAGTERLNAVRHFVHLLDKTTNDMKEEEDICNLKKKIIRRIRDNEELENGLSSMDVKIGLLIKNRISLGEAESHLRKLKKNKSKSTLVMNGGSTTLGRFNKETRMLIQNYEALFTLLQTEPGYLAKLLFCMSTLSSNKFMQSSVFALFDWAQNKREEYLLLKLFKKALQEEIDQKVTKSGDLMTSNSLVIKLVVNFNRGIGMSFQGSNTEQTGKKSLRDILGDRVKEVDIQSHTLLPDLEWNPRSIYQTIIQQEETETGIRSDKDLNASVDECLKNDKVKEVLDKNLNTLSRLVEGFLDAIVSSVNVLPYGLRYLAKCLFESLKVKFPNESEEILLLNVGNLIYYRFINPAIIAPDGFDVIDLKAGEVLSSETRKCLGRIARCLQSAAAGTSDSETSALPPYLRECQQIIDDTAQFSKRFQIFFRAVINVAEPDTRYGVNEYSEATQIQKPQVILNIKDILLTHEYCREYEDVIAPQHNDPLHDILEDLGTIIPEPEQLLGLDNVNSGGGSDQTSQATDAGDHSLIMTLNPQTSLSQDQVKRAELNRLLHETKRLVCQCCRVQSSRNIQGLLSLVSTEDQCEAYRTMFDTDLDVDRIKIRDNLKTLKEESIVRCDDEITKLIANDIRHQHRLRKERKLELAKLEQTFDRLETKNEYYQQQAEYYESYIIDCLTKQSFGSGKKSKGIRASLRPKSSASDGGVKYSAAELLKKEVLVDVVGVDIKAPYKGLHFTIVPVENISGQWNVCAKFMGVNSLTTRIVLQDLLQKQYEGNSYVVLDGKAKVNVNLLLHLLNKKFHTTKQK